MYTPNHPTIQNRGKPTPCVYQELNPRPFRHFFQDKAIARDDLLRYIAPKWVRIIDTDLSPIDLASPDILRCYLTKWEPLLKLTYQYSKAEFPTDKQPLLFARSVAILAARTPQPHTAA